MLQAAAAAYKRECMTRSRKDMAARGASMTARGEIALAFCKECLGWKHAQGMNDYGHFYIYEDVTRELADTPIPPWRRHFRPNDLDVVLKATKTWCDASAATLTLHYFPSGSA